MLRGAYVMLSYPAIFYAVLCGVIPVYRYRTTPQHPVPYLPRCLALSQSVTLSRPDSPLYSPLTTSVSVSASVSVSTPAPACGGGGGASCRTRSSSLPFTVFWNLRGSRPRGRRERSSGGGGGAPGDGWFGSVGGSDAGYDRLGGSSGNMNRRGRRNSVWLIVSLTTSKRTIASSIRATVNDGSSKNYKATSHIATFMNIRFSYVTHKTLSQRQNHMGINLTSCTSAPSPSSMTYPHRGPLTFRFALPLPRSSPPAFLQYDSLLSELALEPVTSRVQRALLTHCRTGQTDRSQRVLLTH